jgi:hypothetical protein
MVRAGLALIAALVIVGWTPGAASAATCSDYSNQADAQRAADTRDADGDGIYCESLPCPCLKPGDTTGGGNPTPTPAPKPKSSCNRPQGVQRITFSRKKYPNIRLHYIAAVRRGWPRVMVVNRKGADARRDRLLEMFPTRAGFDRDEYPAAVGRGKPNGDQRGLVRGVNPVGWMADVAYVPSSENRSHGSSLGAKLRAFCDGTRFRYVFA